MAHGSGCSTWHVSEVGRSLGLGLGLGLALGLGLLAPEAAAGRFEKLLEKGRCAEAAAAADPQDPAATGAVALCHAEAAAWQDLAAMGLPASTQGGDLVVLRLVAVLAEGGDGSAWSHEALQRTLGWSEDRLVAVAETPDRSWLGPAAAACLPAEGADLWSWSDGLSDCLAEALPEEVRATEEARGIARAEAARLAELLAERARPRSISVGGGHMGAFALAPSGPGRLAFVHENAEGCTGRVDPGAEYLFVKVVDLEAEALTAEVLAELPAGKCTDFILWSGDGSRLAVGWGSYPETTTSILDAETGEVLATLRGPRDLFVSRDGTALQRVRRESGAYSMKRWRFADGEALPTVVTRPPSVDGERFHLRRAAAVLVQIVPGAYDARTDSKGAPEARVWDLETGELAATHPLRESWEPGDLVALLDEAKPSTGQAFVVAKAMRMAGYPPLEGPDPGLDGTSEASIYASFIARREGVSRLAYAGVDLAPWCHGPLRLPEDLLLEESTHGPRGGTGSSEGKHLDQRVLSDSRIVVSLKPTAQLGSYGSGHPPPQLWLVERGPDEACAVQRLLKLDREASLWWDATEGWLAASLDVKTSRDGRHRELTVVRLPPTRSEPP